MAAKGPRWDLEKRLQEREANAAKEPRFYAAKRLQSLGVVKAADLPAEPTPAPKKRKPAPRSRKGSKKKRTKRGA